MEMNDNAVEHLATTVDKGLKMKIKRKHAGSRAPETKARSVQEESSSFMQKNSGFSQVDSMACNESRQCEDESSGSASMDGLSQRSQKRKRNNRNGKSRDTEPDEKQNNETENRSKGRDLCQGNRGKDVGSANRKRLVQEAGGEAKDFINSAQDKDEPNRIGNRNSESHVSTVNGERQDPAYPAENPDHEKFSSALVDPYEFISKVEDLHQAPIKKFKSEKTDSDMLSTSSSSKVKCDVGTLTCSAGVMTDPDCIGPCEPGTSVILEGIVWSESNNGILVVNVTWRGKTYVGTLMDATKHHWASPRFREESPSTDIDYRLPKAKRGTPVTDVTEGRRLRKCRRTAASASSSSSSSGTTAKTLTTRQSPPIAIEMNGRSRGRATEQHNETAAESTQPTKRAKLDQEANDETFYKCRAADCSKKFKHISGLRYHQSYAHRKQTIVSTVSTQKSEPTPGTDVVAQEKCKSSSNSSRKNEESSSARLSVSQDTLEPVSLEPVSVDPLPDQEVGNTPTVNKDVMSGVLDKEQTETPVKIEADKSENPDQCNSNGDSEHNFGDKASTTSLSQAVITSDVTSPCCSVEATTSHVIESSQPGPRENLERMIETVASSCSSSTQLQTDSFPNTAGFHVVNPGPPVEAAKTEFTVSQTVLDLHEKARNRPSEGGAVVDLPSSEPVPVFHTPVLRTPDVNKHKSIPQNSDKYSQHARLETGQPMAVLRPQNIGLKLSPPGVCNSDDKSPAYSDISDANDGTFSESETRIRKSEKDLKRLQRSEKQSIGKYEDYGNSGHHTNSSSHSPFPSPAPTSLSSGSIRKPSDAATKIKDEPDLQGRKLVNIVPAKSGSVGGKQPTAPINDRQRCDRSSRPPEYSTDILQAAHHESNGRMWMEMLQRSSLNAASMMQYGYAVDPMVHMQLMASNPEYRNHYERWLMAQPCYRQMLQAESDRCLAGDKPVDMSAKSASSNVANGGSESATRSKTSNKLSSRPGCENHEDRTSLENHRGDSSVSILAHNSSDSFGKSNVNNHFEMNASSRDRLPSLKQEPGRQKTFDKDEKPVDLILHQGSPNITKSKGKLGDGPNFSCMANKSKAFGPVSSSSLLSHQVTHAQEYLKTSAPQHRYDAGSFASLAGFGTSSFLDSGSLPTVVSASAAGAATRYQDLNSKYSPLSLHAEKSVAPVRRSDQSTSVLSSKNLSPAPEKNEPRRLLADSFDFSNEGSLQDKPAVSSSSSGSPLTLRHLHTHHHTHVVGPAYPLYSSYNAVGLMPPNIVPPVVPVIPPPYIPK